MNGHDPEHGEHTPPPKLLLPNATVTIFFDGLIYTAYNEKKKLYQAAVHTEAEGHELTVDVTLIGNPKPLFPTAELPWDGSHATVKKKAPFWLFVDSGEGRPKDYSAELYLPDDQKDDRSFDRILNFERLYDREITLNTNRYAEFNFPHGICYSAQDTKATLSKLDQKGSPIRGAKPEDIHVSTLGAIDIDSVSEGAARKEIVLESKEGKVFSFPLETGKHYVIKIINGPVKHHTSHDPNDHFLQFYELFPLNPGDPKFLVDPAEAHTPPPSPDSPPCILGGGGKGGGLP